MYLNRKQTDNVAVSRSPDDRRKLSPGQIENIGAKKCGTRQPPTLLLLLLLVSLHFRLPDNKKQSNTFFAVAATATTTAALASSMEFVK